MNRIHLFAVSIVCAGSFALWTSHDHDSRKTNQKFEPMTQKPALKKVTVSKLALAKEPQKRQ